MKKREPIGIYNLLFAFLVFIFASFVRDNIPLLAIVLSLFIPIFAIVSMIRISINKDRYSKLGYLLGFSEIILSLPIIFLVFLLTVGNMH